MSNESKSFGIIYCATNIITGKCYIGQTVRTLNERKGCHIFDAVNNRDKMYFHKSLRKYGKYNFKWEILCECSTREELNEKEKYYIKELNTFIPNGYNLTLGGDGKSGYKCTDETKKKLSDRKGKKHPFYGKKHTDEAKKKMSVSKQNITDETKKKMSESHKGKKHTDEHKRKISEKSKGNKRCLGYKHTDEAKKKMADRQNNNKSWKIIYPSGEMKIVNGLKNWCKEIGFNYKNVHNSFIKNGKYKGYLITKII